MCPGLVWAKTSNFFSIFLKVFENEENHQIFTPGKLKYKNQLIWMKNVHMCERSRECPRSGMGENFNFFEFFLKVFENEENHHIFTLGQLNYKNSLIWMKTVDMCELSQKCPQVRGGRKLQFLRFFEKFSKTKKLIIFSLQDN